MKYVIHFSHRVFLLVGIVFIISCNSSQKKKNPEKLGSFEKGSYGYDLALLKKHTNPVELKSGNSRILVSPEYQGRVMTSSSEGREGKSYGWINHDLIAGGEILEQINPVGGEERFWLGPEGGQFSIFFKEDGKERGKLGLPPERVLPLIGSYDGENRALTVVKCDIPEGITDYVNSSWEFQEFPYRGDAINSYNDGPVAGGTQLGPFYELETSSPALALKPTESAVYSQSTFHFEGTREELNALCQQIFDISIDEVEDAFP